MDLVEAPHSSQECPALPGGIQFFRVQEFPECRIRRPGQVQRPKGCPRKGLKGRKTRSRAVRQVFRRNPQSILRRPGETVRWRSGGRAESGRNLRRQIWTQGGAVIYEVAGDPSGSPAHRPPVTPEEARNRARPCRANPAACGRSGTGAEIGARGALVAASASVDVPAWEFTWTGDRRNCGWARTDREPLPPPPQSCEGGMPSVPPHT